MRSDAIERKNQRIGSVYKLTPDDLKRVGLCWAADRLLVGDLLLCVRHAGDCFCKYVLIQQTLYSDGTRIKRMVTEEIGAYDLGIETYALGAMDFAKILEGEEVTLTTKHRVVDKPSHRR